MPIHVEDGEFDGGDGDPDGEALGFVVACVDGDGWDELLDVAGVLADEEGCDVFGEHRVEDFHLLGVGDGEAFVAVFGADAAEVLFLIEKEFDGLDDDGVGEELALEDRLLEDGVELGVALFESSGQGRGAGRLRNWAWAAAGSAGGSACGGEDVGEECGGGLRARDDLLRAFWLPKRLYQFCVDWLMVGSFIWVYLDLWGKRYGPQGQSEMQGFLAPLGNDGLF